MKTLQEVEREYGKIEGYISYLRELNAFNDLRQIEISDILRDVNFILEQAGQDVLNEFELIERI